MKNHYIIGRSVTKDGDRKFFGRVENINRGILEGYVEKNCHFGGTHKKPFEIPLKSVVLDLGPEPAPGSVYGFDVTNRFYKSKYHDFFGNVCFMYHVDKEAARKLFGALDAAAKILTKWGIHLPATQCVWQIMHKESKGKWAGFYKHSPDPEKTPYLFAIKPESLPDSEFVYVILHEVAHFIHRNYLTSPKANARWIRLFNTSIKLQSFKKETMVALVNDLIAGEERPSDFKSGLDEENTLAFNWAIRTIRQDHSVSMRELDCLFEAEDKDEIVKLWPQRTLHKKDLAPVVSEYATTNYHELFAESVAFHLTKRKLPAPIAALVEKSLSVAKANQGTSDD